MALDRFFPLSDWTQILIIRRFHHACRFPARVNSYFQLLTYHYIARATLIDCEISNFIKYIDFIYKESIWPQRMDLIEDFHFWWAVAMLTFFLFTLWKVQKQFKNIGPHKIFAKLTIKTLRGHQNYYLF